MNNAFAHAVRLLSTREHGAHELVSKLTTKGYEAEAIEGAILECQRLGLQSDSRFVEHVCRVRIRQGYGPVRIRRELQSLHIESELIEDILGQEKENWLSHAIGVWKKKYKKQEDYSYDEIQKQKQFLLYRGFSTDTITMIFKEMIP